MRKRAIAGERVNESFRLKKNLNDHQNSNSYPNLGVAENRFFQCEMGVLIDSKLACIEEWTFEKMTIFPEKFSQFWSVFFA